MLSIDEAIAKYKKLANNDRNCYPEEAQQLAEWLEELKELREKNETLKALYEDVRKEGNNLLKRERNKAIDDFVKNISLEISESIIWGMLVNSHKDNSFNDTSDKIVDYVINTANEIAEQLKAGGADETVLQILHISSCE